MEENKKINEFEKLLSVWKDVLRWKLCNYIAIKTPEGQQLLFDRIILDSDPQKHSPFMFESQYVVAGRELVEIDNVGIIDECIKKARFGGLIFAGQEILLPKNSNLNTILYPFYHPDINFGPRLPCLSLHSLV